MVELAKELHVFVNIVKGALLGSSGEENGSVSAWDGVFLRRGLVIGSRLDLLNVTKRKWLVKRRVESGCGLGSLQIFIMSGFSIRNLASLFLSLLLLAREISLNIINSIYIVLQFRR